MSKQEVKHIVLRCLAYPGKVEDKDGYFAVCIDLNLVTWRPRLPDAEKSLFDAIQGYLETVTELVKEDKDLHGLLPRPAAFWPHRAMYHYAAFMSALPRFGKHKDSILFDKPVDFPYSSAMA
jgi:hypothetical protein